MDNEWAMIGQLEQGNFDKMAKRKASIEEMKAFHRMLRGIAFG